MFSFDDRFIVFTIVIPGIFLLGNIYLTFYFLQPAITETTYDFGFIESLYGLAIALILGAVNWVVHYHIKIIEAFSTEKLLKKIKEKSYHPEFINLKKLKKQYKKDFGKPFLLDSKNTKNQQAYLRESINNMYFTMNRALGLEKPSAYRLMLDAYAHLFIATLLSILLFLIIVICFSYNIHDISGEIWWFLVGLLIMLILLSVIIKKSREKYHFAIIMVYLDKQYRGKMKKFINGN